MSADPRARILTLLASLEQEEGVRILHACEGGSRAWGFASSDSDFDVRFIYLRPREWYLRVEPAPIRGRGSIIQHMSADRVVDIVGWDLRKALALLHKSNPPLLEHMHSPIIYRSSTEADDLARLASRYDSPARRLSHYLHMAEGNYRTYLQGERVRTKKYLYVLRPVLACRWIEQGRGVTPVEFARLVESVLPQASNDVVLAVEDLLARKRSGLELDEGPRIPVLSDFLSGELDRLAKVKTDLRIEELGTEPLNVFFRRAAGL